MKYLKKIYFPSMNKIHKYSKMGGHGKVDVITWFKQLHHLL